MPEKYEILYDYSDGGGCAWHDLHDIFTGTWDELQEEIKRMKEHGCFHIEANRVGNDS